MSFPSSGPEKRTAFLGGIKSDVLPRGEESADTTAEEGAEKERGPGRNRAMRIFNEVRERLDCGVDGVLEVIVVDDAVDKPGVGDDAVEVTVLGFLRADRAGGGGKGGDVEMRCNASN